jgi:hypothetical protein
MWSEEAFVFGIILFTMISTLKQSETLDYTRGPRAWRSADIV